MQSTLVRTLSRVLALAALALLAGAATRASAQTSCIVSFELRNTGAFNSFDFEVDYSAASGDFEGTLGEVNCRDGVLGAFTAYRDEDSARRVSATLATLTQFHGPLVLVGCRFLVGASVPSAGDFVVSTTAAGRLVDGDEVEVNPPPSLKVLVECPGQFPADVTTTTTVTSTTLEVASTTSTTLQAGDGDCGQPVSTGASPSATDALFTLQTAVDQRSCPLCVCDVDDSGAVVASDALAILRASVGVSTSLECPVCG
jgi:hypothetical protein